jgi:hypothetical protein
MIRLLRFIPRRWWSPEAWRTWKQFVHWRLETYGVYYPSNEKNPAAFRALMRQLPSYLKWLKELDQLHSKEN